MSGLAGVVVGHANLAAALISARMKSTEARR